MDKLSNSVNIDPRQPRFAAGITSLVTLVALAAAFMNENLIATLIYVYIVVIFIWSVAFRRAWHPYKFLFNTIAKKLNPPAYMEDPRAPHFAQKVGLLVSSGALILSIVSPIFGIAFGIMLFFASALNAYFNICLGCIVYLRLKRLGINL